MPVNNFRSMRWRHERKPRCNYVGAESAGLVMVKQLKEKGANFIVLERNDMVGGI